MNVKQYKVDRLNQAEKLNPEQRSVRLMKEIQAQLQLEKMPNHIECFDNSNIQGADAVAACVVFKKAKPSKKTTGNTLSKRWWDQMITLPCRKWYVGATAAFWKSKVNCPT